jgi:glycosyltransferase involved in cell wall biosynthesis
MPDGDAVAVLLKGYPRLSETFIAQELRGLEERGFKLKFFSLRHPTDKKRHPIHSEIEAPVAYLPEYLHQEPMRVYRAWRKLRGGPLYKTAYAVWRRDLKRDRTRNRIRRFGQALVLAAEMPSDIGHIYAHFLHTPASVARYAAILTMRPWSVSAHAKDIWTSPDWELSEKLADCEWAATCTGTGAAHLADLAFAGGAPRERVNLVYHGLDLRRFPAAPPHGMADGSKPDTPVKIVTVCRAVPKKGLEDLLQALSMLPADLHWRLDHIGGGPLLDALEKQAESLGISDNITWRGAMAQADVIAAYGAADLFVLPAKIAADGDRDGLPNVLMEAASQALPLIASDVSAIPEFIRDGETGLMTAPGDASSVARALESLIRHPDQRLRLGRAAEGHVRSTFDFNEGVDQIAALLTQDAGRRAVA